MDPSENDYYVFKTLTTQMKPTCLIQLSSKHLAIAEGNLREKSLIEVHDINNNKVVSVLSQHTNMIDSLLKLEFSAKKIHCNGTYIQWILSASRDRTLILWKLIDGKIMQRNVLE